MNKKTLINTVIVLCVVIVALGYHKWKSQAGANQLIVAQNQVMVPNHQQTQDQALNNESATQKSDEGQVNGDNGQLNGKTENGITVLQDTTDDQPEAVPSDQNGEQAINGEDSNETDQAQKTDQVNGDEDTSDENAADVSDEVDDSSFSFE